MMGSKSRMQGKEASEQETKGKSNAGIDVSKSWLDAHVLPAGATLRVANTREGIRKLKRWLMPFDVALVVIEATGKWHRDVRRSLQRLAKDIAALEREILKCIQADQGLARRYAILTSITGCGPVVATTLIACLAELGTCSRKQIGMLAGLAPVADESGQRQGIRVVWGGRPNIRRVLYLAAITAARFDPDMKAFFNRLIAAGKPAKLAIIAVARKLVVLANILISEGRMWQPHSPKHA